MAISRITVPGKNKDLSVSVQPYPKKIGKIFAIIKNLMQFIGLAIMVPVYELIHVYHALQIIGESTKH